MPRESRREIGQFDGEAGFLIPETKHGGVEDAVFGFCILHLLLMDIPSAGTLETNLLT